jgi:hypothetical protein
VKDQRQPVDRPTGANTQASAVGQHHETRLGHGPILASAGRSAALFRYLLRNLPSRKTVVERCV